MADDVTQQEYQASFQRLEHPGVPNVTPRPADAADPLNRLDYSFGNPEWRDERIPLEARMSDAAQLHMQQGAEQGQPFQAVLGRIQSYFPQINAQALQQPYEQQFQMARARQAYAQADPDAADLIRRHPIPFTASFRRTEDTQNYANAQRRFQAGNPLPTDYEEIARYERRQAVERNYSPVQQLALTALDVPAMVGEAYIGGRALSGIGRALGWAAPEATQAAAQIGARYPALAQAGSTAATTASMPSMYLPQAAEHALEHGGQWSELQNLAPAYAVGYLNTAILGNVMTPHGGGIANYLKRVAAGVGEQQLVDFAAHGLKLQTRYGAINELIDGKPQDALFHVATQALTFGLFGALHAGTPGKTILGEFRESVNALSRTGLSRAAVGRTLAEVTQPILNDLRQNGEPTRPPLIDPRLPESVQRYVDTLHELMTEGARSVAERQRAEAPPEPQRPVEPTPQPPRVSAPITPDQAAAALATEQAKGSSRNRVEPRTPPKAPPTLQERLAALPEADLRALHQQLMGVKGASKKGMVDQLAKVQGIEAVLGAMEAPPAPKKPTVIQPLPPEAPPVAPQAPPEAPAAPVAARPPEVTPTPPERPGNAWNNTGTHFMDRPDGSLEFAGKNGQKYTMRADLAPAPKEAAEREGQERVRVRAYDAAGNEVGHVDFYQTPEGHWRGEGLGVEKGHRGAGISEAMYDFLASQGEHPVPGPGQTPEGKRFWERNRKAGQTEAGGVEPAASVPEAVRPEVVSEPEPPTPPVKPALTPEQRAAEMKAATRIPAAQTWNRMSGGEREAAARAMKAEGVPQKDWAQHWHGVEDAQKQSAAYMHANPEVKLTEQERAEARKKVVAREARRQIAETPLPPDLERRIDEHPDLGDAEKDILKERSRGNSWRAIEEITGINYETARKKYKPALEKFGEDAEHIQDTIDESFLDNARRRAERFTEKGFAQTEGMTDEVVNRELAQLEADVRDTLEDIKNATIRSATAGGLSEKAVRREIEAAQQGDEPAEVPNPRAGGAPAGAGQTPEGPAKAAGRGEGGRAADTSAAGERGAARRDLLTARTGQPLRMVGYRSETGEQVPGRGVFYQGAAEGPFTFKGKAKAKELEFQNPLVLEGNKETDFIDLRQLKEKLGRKLPFEDLTRQEAVGDYEGDLVADFDRQLAQAAREAGYDGVIFRAGSLEQTEIMDLRGERGAARRNELIERYWQLYAQWRETHMSLAQANQRRHEALGLAGKRAEQDAARQEAKESLEKFKPIDKAFTEVVEELAKELGVQPEEGNLRDPVYKALKRLEASGAAGGDELIVAEGGRARQQLRELLGGLFRVGDARGLVEATNYLEKSLPLDVVKDIAQEAIGILDAMGIERKPLGSEDRGFGSGSGNRSSEQINSQIEERIANILAPKEAADVEAETSRAGYSPAKSRRSLRQAARRCGRV